MIPNSEWPCWEIMKCKGTDTCPARQQPAKSCWEIARELDDYRSAFNICQDCIVYMLKEGSNTILSEKEMQTIVRRKVACAMA